MQAVILAAGKGTRMLPLTLTTPKPLVKVGDEPILSHIMRQLPAEVDEVVLVIGHLGDRIKEFYGDEFEGKRLVYVWQENATGTADALNVTAPYIRGKFLLLYGDDIVGRESLEDAIQHDLAILAYEHSEAKNFGVILHTDEGNLVEIIEKPETPPSNLIFTGSMVLDRRIFELIKPTPADHENWLTWYITELAQERPVRVVQQKHWCPVGRVEDIPRAELFLRTHLA